MKKFKIGYMCDTDFIHELEVDNPNFVEVYSTAGALTKDKKSHFECDVHPCRVMKVKIEIIDE